MATLMPGVLNRTLSHIWLNWNISIFLFSVGLFTLMKMDSLINLVKSYPSLPVMLKLSWVVVCPICWLCSWIGEGSSEVLFCTFPQCPRCLSNVFFSHILWLNTDSNRWLLSSFLQGPCPWPRAWLRSVWGFCCPWSESLYHTWSMCT